MYSDYKCRNRQHTNRRAIARVKCMFRHDPKRRPVPHCFHHLSFDFIIEGWWFKRTVNKGNGYMGHSNVAHFHQIINNPNVL